jgi:hypothetical protein
MASPGIGAGVGVDTRDLKTLITATRKASVVAGKGIHTAMVAAGEIVAVEARTLAAQHSTTIAQTVRAQARGATVTVKAGGAAAPVAAPYESARTGMFRHPVFANRENWVEQPGYPFLRPAAKNKMTEVEAAVLKIADDMARVLRTQ